MEIKKKHVFCCVDFFIMIINHDMCLNTCTYQGLNPPGVVCQGTVVNRGGVYVTGAPSKWERR